MPGWTDAITIEASPEQVFEIVSDVERAADWIPNITGIEALWQGDIREGSQWRETRCEGKREYSLVITVYEIHRPKDGNPPYVFSAGARVMGMKNHYRFSMSPQTDHHTLLKLEAEVETGNPVKAIVAWLMVKMMKKADADLLVRLKQLCERGA
jgi:carbon monoxide dehydrogenase subunit G